MLTPMGLIAIALAAIAAFASFKNFRFGLTLTMILVVLEGALRKWVFPDAQQLLYFAKDFILVVAWIGCWRHSKRSVRAIPAALSLLIVVVTLIAVAGLLNPSLPSLLLGLVGLKSYVLYILLLTLVPAAYPTPADLEAALRRYVLLAIPTTMLATIQFREPQSSLWNRYSNEGGEGAAVFGDLSFVRVTSSFPYISGYAVFLLTIAIAVLVLLSIRDWKLRGNVSVYLSGIAALVAMPMTGSRGPVYMFAIVGPLILLMLAVKGRVRPSTAIRALASVAFIAAVLIYFAAEPITALVQRATGTQEEGRAVTPIFQSLDAVDSAGLFGYGTGTTHNSAPAIVRNVAPYSWLGEAAFQYEDEWARIIVELGAVGFFFMMAIRLYLIFFALRVFLTVRDPLSQCLAAGAFAYFVAHLPTTIVFNPTTGIYYWFVAGAVVALRRWQLVQQARVPVQPQYVTIQSPDRASRPAAFASSGARPL